MEAALLQNRAENANVSSEVLELESVCTPLIEQRLPLISIDKIHYIHLRRYNVDNTINPHGGTTIAFRVTEEFADDLVIALDDGDDEELKQDAALIYEPFYCLELAWADCMYSYAPNGIKDLFVKQKGRQIATHRLESDTYTRPLNSLYPNHPTLNRVINAVKELWYDHKETFEPQARLIYK